MSDVENGVEGKKVASVKTVTMDDGRVVEFVGKRVLIKRDEVVDGIPGVRFDFVNGETRFVGIDIGGLSEKMAQHGLKQKIGDEMAGAKCLEDGIMDIDDLIDRLAKGDFNSVKVAGGNAGGSILVKALVEVLGKDVETVKAWLAKQTPEAKKALRKHPPVAAVIHRLESEKEKKAPGVEVDTEALLAGFDE